MSGSTRNLNETRAHEIDTRRRELVEHWPTGWRQMTAEWRADGPDRGWLMYAANYLLRTGDTRWAIDVTRLGNKVGEAEPVSPDALEPLEFVLLTHRHDDHVDREMIAGLQKFGHIRWIVPDHMVATARECGVSDARMIVPDPAKPLRFGAVTITVFPGLHWEYPGAWGVGKPVAGIESSACLVEWAGRRVLFPGDTRTYDVSALPTLGPIDTLCAHVWLGRGAALLNDPPMFDPMVEFVSTLAPRRRVTLAHLWEVARGPTDYWNVAHAERVRERLRPRLPGATITIPDLWTPFEL